MSIIRSTKRMRDREREIVSIEWKPPDESTFSDLTDAIDSGICRVVFSPQDDDPIISTARIHLEPKPDREQLRQRMRELKYDGAIPRFRMRFTGAEEFTPGVPVWTLLRGTSPNFDSVAYKVLAPEDKLAPYF